MPNLTATDEDELLEIDEAKASDATPSKDELMMNILTQMSANLNTVSESLKHLHQSNSTTADAAVPAKKAKPAVEVTLSESDNSDCEELLTNKADSGAINGQRDESPDGLLDEIAQSLDETERTDEAVAEKLADIANKRWLQMLSDEKLKEKLEKCPRPVNCDKIIVPKVNPEIWGKLSRQAKGNDLQFSRLQTHLTKVGHIVVKSTDLLLKAKADSSKSYIDDLVRMNTDAIALLGHVSFEISQRRRESIRPHLHKDYAALCSSTMPVTNFLFGDELQAQLSHIRASNKIGNTTSTTNTHKRVYNQGGHGFKNSKPFLGRAPYQSHSRLNSRARNTFNSSSTRTKSSSQFQQGK